MNRKEYSKAYYQTHKKEIKEYSQAHKDESKAYHKAYHAAHKAEDKAYQKAYRAVHKAEAKEYMKKYMKFHERQHYCCEDISKIENYELAKADNFVNWDIHHRLETNTLDGIRRSVNITSKELMKLGMYYNRPASELIFMTHREHRILHMKKH